MEHIPEAHASQHVRFLGSTWQLVALRTKTFSIKQIRDIWLTKYSYDLVSLSAVLQLHRMCHIDSILLPTLDLLDRFWLLRMCMFLDCTQYNLIYQARVASDMCPCLDQWHRDLKMELSKRNPSCVKRNGDIVYFQMHSVAFLRQK